MLKRRTRAGAPPELLDYVLGSERSEAELAATPGYDVWASWFDYDPLPDAEFAALLERHRGAIEAEAARRGITRPWPELVAHRGSR